MTTGSMDYTALLREAIAEARAAGLDSAASDLEQSCVAVAFTTSSELLAEHGLAIKRFLKATRGTLPPSTKAKLHACLRETELAWPGWRRLVALLRGRRVGR